ncbi:hypothetical protein GCM10009655_14160 [Rhodoglobus aureus]|uniref:Uncharacterized protein n=1 Tax=Rhodoglobus aureus TaxID=191497 RepID=A0ABP4GEY3_9MICO
MHGYRASGASNPSPNGARVSRACQVKAANFQLFIAQRERHARRHDARINSRIYSCVDLTCVSFVARHEIRLDPAADERPIEKLSL